GDEDRRPGFLTRSGEGVFSGSIEKALLDRRIDMAVHSLKDVPTRIARGTQLAAVSRRESPRDVLYNPRAQTLTQLPLRARVGTSSPRRIAQLLSVRQDLIPVPLRGNVPTRIKAAGRKQCDAVVVAEAALRRLGSAVKRSMVLRHALFLPAAGQGFLAIQIRAGDPRSLRLARAFHHQPSGNEAFAERAFLRTLEAGCRAPCGVFARQNGSALSVRAVVFSSDGSERLEARLTGEPRSAALLGARLARQLMARGASKLVADARVAEKAGKTFAGRMIVTTRPEGSDDSLSAAIRLRGGYAPALPLHRLDFSGFPLRAILKRLSSFDAVVFSSPNGVRAFCRACGGRLPRRPGQLKTACVGESTRRELEAAGWKCNWVPSRYTTRDLFRGLPGIWKSAGKRRVLALRSALAQPAPHRWLTARGIHLEDLPAYGMRPLHSSRIRLNLKSIIHLKPDAFVFTSPVAVRYLQSAIGQSSLPKTLKDARIFSIGPVTTQALRQAGIRGISASRRFTIDGLIRHMEKVGITS
ncbi:MAG: hydroxymethylbilane synthase, partial [Candidatus Omnitrophica bacterium]|nr:hydroxymethylbilane synthase [Candidatus Omnitrophota bacterium]